jgi:hypothetical protein
MFHFGLADVVQAEREREIAELVRVRRLLKPEPEATDTPNARTSEARTKPVRARAAGG